MRDYGVGGEPQCDLALVGKGEFNGGFIMAYRLSPELTNVQSGVVILRAAALRNQGVIESSWKEKPFVTGSGLHGVRTSFTQQYPSAIGGVMTQITHEFLVTNAQSRCEFIRYICSSPSIRRPGDYISESRSEEAQRTIERTLRVE